MHDPSTDPEDRLDCASFDPASGAPPPAYTTACASCHGATGEGKGYYPSLRQNLVMGQVATVVRGGKVSTKTMITTAEGHEIPARMPAFDTDRVSNDDLAAIYQYISTPLKPDAVLNHCLSRPEASWTEEQIDEAYQRGLKAWRTPGEVDNNA